jgi:hypothetical protein
MDAKRMNSSPLKSYGVILDLMADAKDLHAAINVPPPSVDEG